MSKKVILKIDEVTSQAGQVMNIDDTLNTISTHNHDAVYPLKPVANTNDGEYLTWDGATLGKHELGIFRPAAGTIAMTDAVRMDKPMRAQAVLTTGAIDVSQSNYFVCNCTGATTFSFSNVPTDADVVSLVLQLHNAGSYAMTFPPEVKWGGGAAPAFTVGASDLVGFITLDRGANWRGMGLNFNAAVPFVDPSAS